MHIITDLIKYLQVPFFCFETPYLFRLLLKCTDIQSLARFMQFFFFECEYLLDTEVEKKIKINECYHGYDTSKLSK